MTHSINSLRITTIYKIVLLGSAGFFLPVFILGGVLSFFGIIPANLNDVKYYGLEGLAIHIFYSPLIILLFTLFIGTVLGIGFKIYKTTNGFYYALFKRKK